MMGEHAGGEIWGSRAPFGATRVQPPPHNRSTKRMRNRGRRCARPGARHVHPRCVAPPHVSHSLAGAVAARLREDADDGLRVLVGRLASAQRQHAARAGADAVCARRCRCRRGRAARRGSCCRAAAQRDDREHLCAAHGADISSRAEEGMVVWKGKTGGLLAKLLKKRRAPTGIKKMPRWACQSGRGTPNAAQSQGLYKATL